MSYKGWENFDAGKHQARVRGQTKDAAVAPQMNSEGQNACGIAEPSIDRTAESEHCPPQLSAGSSRPDLTYGLALTANGRIGFIEFQIVPVAKPRQSQSDKWKQRPAVMAYRAFADDLRAQAEAQGFVLPDCGWSVTFHLPMPPSWSAKKRAAMFGQPHQSKPDLDNLLKALKDSLRADDSPIWEITGLRKYWSDVGRIIIRVET